MLTTATLALWIATTSFSRANPPPGLAPVLPPPAERDRGADSLRSPAPDRARFLRLVARNPPDPHPEPAYRFQAELYAQLAQLVEERPGVVQVERIGSTVERRPIWAFHITDPQTAPTTTVLVSASIHSLEWMGAEVATDFARTLTHAPAPGVRVTIVPILNVDGRARVEADLRAGENRYRRTNANGVDLNRDFASNREARAIWRHILPRRYTTSPAPLSQPESQAIDRLAQREAFDVAVSLHAWGGYLYYPWAGRWERPEDRSRFETLGRVMQSGQGARAYRVQQLGRWAFFFRGHGMELDHLYEQYGTHAFLMELTRSGLSLRHPADRKVNFRWYNPRDPGPDTDRGVGALLALVRHLEGEAGAP